MTVSLFFFFFFFSLLGTFSPAVASSSSSRGEPNELALVTLSCLPLPNTGAAGPMTVSLFFGREVGDGAVAEETEEEATLYFLPPSTLDDGEEEAFGPMTVSRFFFALLFVCEAGIMDEDCGREFEGVHSGSK